MYRQLGRIGLHNLLSGNFTCRFHRACNDSCSVGRIGLHNFSVDHNLTNSTLLSGFIEHGSLGSMCMQNIISTWQHMFACAANVQTITTPLMLPERVFAASGHLKKFADYVVKVIL